MFSLLRRTTTSRRANATTSARRTATARLATWRVARNDWHRRLVAPGVSSSWMRTLPPRLICVALLASIGLAACSADSGAPPPENSPAAVSPTQGHGSTAEDSTGSPAQGSTPTPADQATQSGVATQDNSIGASDEQSPQRPQQQQPREVGLEVLSPTNGQTVRLPFAVRYKSSGLSVDSGEVYLQISLENVADTPVIKIPLERRSGEVNVGDKRFAGIRDLKFVLGREDSGPFSNPEATMVVRNLNIMGGR